MTLADRESSFHNRFEVTYTWQFVIFIFEAAPVSITAVNRARISYSRDVLALMELSWACTDC